MKTAIILVTYNHYCLTKDCLNDIKTLSQSEFIVAIADNASSDNTVQNVKEEFPFVHIFALQKNVGFGRANNYAVKKLSESNIDFDKIIFLNNDTRLNPADLMHLATDIDAYKNAIIAPHIVDKEYNHQTNYFTKISKFQFLINAFRSAAQAAKVIQGTPKKITENIYEPYWTAATVWAMSKKTWERIGGFDESIFMYNEDYDFALRARKIGVKFFIDESVKITHLGGASKKSTLVQSLQHDNTLEYVFKKHYGFSGLIVSKSFRIFRSSLRIALSVPFLFKKNFRDYAKLHFKLLLNVFKSA